MAALITVTIKLYSGIDKELGLTDYDSGKGIVHQITDGKRLGALLKGLGLKKLSRFAFFRNGERIGTWTRLRNNDEVSCLKPSGGG